MHKDLAALDTMTKSLAFLHVLQKLINPDGILEADERGHLSWMLEDLLDKVDTGITVLRQQGGRP